ncbi:GlsB/YeaQ/YmgE family stress response membrane protein [Spongiibacter nanhainus]|uniref:GlsB/YeaQ/YmgE family stress response membrane protein n=1 Tax=Spongiibacter nanhainus TaxID=2794344 RepID=A0A7T4R0X3_9GAMM|nr:GlsB/YeaQ/YmgE family stress response membrane protein [Spongiibacter nanhainus]QQD18390.1 GlsB/YeaQ/YmgE family stress response membrane protein [Spongiibacter nanhainus]
MGILSWIVFGLIAGALAKWIMPGKDPGGFLVTMGIGIAGAFVGGFVGTLLGFGGISGFNLGSMVLAVLGAIGLLALYRQMKK